MDRRVHRTFPDEDRVTWKGVHLSALKCSFNSPQYPEVVNKDDHTVLVQVPVHYFCIHVIFVFLLRNCICLLLRSL